MNIKLDYLLFGLDNIKKKSTFLHKEKKIDINKNKHLDGQSDKFS